MNFSQLSIKYKVSWVVRSCGLLNRRKVSPEYVASFFKDTTLLKMEERNSSNLLFPI